MSKNKDSEIRDSEISILTPDKFESIAGLMANSTQFLLNGLNRQGFHNIKQIYESPAQNKVQIIQQNPTLLAKGFGFRLAYQFAGVGVGKTAVGYVKQQEELPKHKLFLATVGATFENIYGSLGEIFQSKHNLKDCKSISSFSNQLNTARCVFPLYQVRNMIFWPVLVNGDMTAGEKATYGFALGTGSGIFDGMATHVMRNYDPQTDTAIKSYKNAYEDVMHNFPKYRTSSLFRGAGGVVAATILSPDVTTYLSGLYEEMYHTIASTSNTSDASQTNTETSAQQTSSPNAQVTNHVINPLDRKVQKQQDSTQRR